MATLPEVLAIAIQHHRANELQSAEQIYRLILTQEPNHLTALHMLGVLCHQQGQSEQAVELINQAIQVRPEFAEAYSNLGVVLTALRRLDEALVALHRALNLQPNNAQAHYNLGTCFQAAGREKEAITAYRQSLDLKPDYFEALLNLSVLLRNQGELDEGLAIIRTALEMQPTNAPALDTLGSILKASGAVDEAIQAYRRSLVIAPDSAVTRSNLLFALAYDPNVAPKEYTAELAEFDRLHVQPLAARIPKHTPDLSPTRRLRVGYVSPDLYSHPAGRFMLPLLQAHDHSQLEIYCYASVDTPDVITDRCRASSDLWRDVLHWSDERLADQVREDRIDILVDLSMHSAKNRLLLFARKPAPVQVSYLAYCGTTGLSTIDYRITDSYLEPPAETAIESVEQPIRLPETFWCYRPLVEMPAVSSLPVLETGRITFGSMNNFCKVSQAVVSVWGEVLQRVPNSRLLLHAHPGHHRDRACQSFARLGIAAERVEFVGRVSMTEYYRNCSRIDIALDPFPFGGGTTTCETLWMGAPVITLAGKLPSGRGGVSILSNIGLAELVAVDERDYVRLATELANDIPRLYELRATLRQRMQASPLMDAPRFARNMEAAYREMWQRYCLAEK